MTKEEMLTVLLDNWHKPVIFVDTDHIIRYVNKTAIERFSKWGDILNKSIFHCHKEKSNVIIRECFERLKKGEKEILISDNPRHRVFMRGVFNKSDVLVGYFERYEPPRGIFRLLSKKG